MERNYICTSFGFIKEINKLPYDPFYQKNFEIEYTDKLLNAKRFNSKNAKRVMELYNIVGFIYKPYEEFFIDNEKQYTISKINSIDEYISDINVSVPFYRPVKDQKISDASYLNNNRFKMNTLYSYEEAKQKSVELNKKTVELLNEKVINTINNEIIYLEK